MITVGEPSQFINFGWIQGWHQGCCCPSVGDGQHRRRLAFPAAQDLSPGDTSWRTSLARSLCWSQSNPTGWNHQDLSWRAKNSAHVRPLDKKGLKLAQLGFLSGGHASATAMDKCLQALQAQRKPQLVKKMGYTVCFNIKDNYFILFLGDIRVYHALSLFFHIQWPFIGVYAIFGQRIGITWAARARWIPGGWRWMAKYFVIQYT